MERYYFKVVTYDERNYPSVETVIKYIFREEAATHRGYHSVFVGEDEFIIEQFEYIKGFYGKASGKQIEHFIISFNLNSGVSVEGAVSAAENICYHYREKYQIVYAVHEDTDFLHIHFAMNTISYITGERYNCNRQELQSLHDRIDFECRRVLKYYPKKR